MKKQFFFNIYLLVLIATLIKIPAAVAFDTVSGTLQQNVISNGTSSNVNQAIVNAENAKKQQEAAAAAAATTTQKQPTAAELSAQAQQLQSGAQAGNVGQVANAAKQDTATGSQGAEGSLGAEGGGLGAAMSASENAGQASQDQSKGSGNNAMMSGIMGVMGAAFTAAAVAAQPPPAKIAPAAMAAFSFLQAALGAMQSGNQGDTSGANNIAGNDFKTFGGTTAGGGATTSGGTTSGNGGETNSGGTNSGAGNNSGGADYGDDPYKNLPAGARDALSKMTALGYKVDLKNRTFTTPDGHSISAKDANNGSLVESQLGLPAGTYAKGMDMMAEVAKKNGFSTDGSGIAAGGAGGDGGGFAGDGSGLAEGEGYDGSGGKAGDKNKFGANGARLPASALVAGLTSSYNGERIGVASDDIFMMVTRRYQVKHEQDAFITLDRPGKGILGDLPRK